MSTPTLTSFAAPRGGAGLPWGGPAGGLTWQASNPVREDQGLADVMTDKASVEIPSPVAGRVLALGGEVGQMLAVGSELIRIETSATDLGGLVLAPRPATPAAAPAVAPASASPPTRPPADAQPPAPPAAGRAATPPTAPAPASAATERPIASPALRRRAWELGIDLRKVTPTGTAGRIVQADLDAIVAAGLAPAATLRDDEQRLPVIGLRRRIALQMQEAKRRIPHFSYVEECDVTEVEALRATLNAREGATRGHLTLLPLLVRALVLALREFPQVNARFDDEAGVVTRHGAVHLGVATQTPHGLLVPVLRHAEALDLWSIAAEVARLAESARAGHSTRAELSGSTITVTSLGPLGGIVSTPIINRPEVAIVGVNRIVERPPTPRPSCRRCARASSSRRCCSCRMPGRHPGEGGGLAKRTSAPQPDPGYNPSSCRASAL